jgi:hypothetical protein
MGAQPFGKTNSLADQFVKHAANFQPRLMVGGCGGAGCRGLVWVGLRAGVQQACRLLPAVPCRL